MHAPYILSADDLDDYSGVFEWKPSILAADDLLGACYRKAVTPRKPWTLLFPQLPRKIAKKPSLGTPKNQESVNRGFQTVVGDS